MTVLIENEQLRALISEHGAELTSLVEKNSSREYLWNGDAKYWKRHAPVLFPIEGKLKDDTYFVDRKEFHMTQHGFARDSEFSIVKQTPDSVMLELCSNEQTKIDYPYDFSLKITYELVGNILKTSYTVKNTGTQTMYFGLGAHPAFSTLLAAGDRFEDYVIETEPRTTLLRIPLKNSLIDPKNAYQEKCSPLEITHETFKDDALIYDLKQEKETFILKSKKHGHGVSVSSNDSKALGIWSSYPAKGQFVCIEPWWSVADTIDSDQDFKHKYYTNVLEQSTEFNASFDIKVF
mgnify:FL=1